VMGLGTVCNALANRRDPATGFGGPVVKALAVCMVPVVLIFLGTELPRLQHGLLTQSLTGREWVACFGLASAVAVVVEVSKLYRRRRIEAPEPLDIPAALAPERGTV